MAPVPGPFRSEMCQIVQDDARNVQAHPRGLRLVHARSVAVAACRNGSARR